MVGGHASGLLDGSARYNLVSISGGSITSVAGGSATTTNGTADASFNAVLVSGGSIRDHIVGGIVYASSGGQYGVRYNAVTLTGGHIGGYVFGSALTYSLGQDVFPLPAAGSGNSLNLGLAGHAPACGGLPVPQPCPAQRHAARRAPADTGQ